MIYSNFGSMYRFIYFLNVYSFRLLTTMAPKATKKPAAAPKKATKKPAAAPKKNLKATPRFADNVKEAAFASSINGLQEEGPPAEDDLLSHVPPSQRYELRLRVKRALNTWAEQMLGGRRELYPEVSLLNILWQCGVDVQTHESDSDSYHSDA